MKKVEKNMNYPISKWKVGKWEIVEWDGNRYQIVKHTYNPTTKEFQDQHISLSGEDIMALTKILGEYVRVNITTIANIQ